MIFMVGLIYSSYVRSTILYAYKCWPAKKEDLRCLECYERSMMRWMRCIMHGVHTSSDNLCHKLGLADLYLEPRYRHLRWFSQVQCSSQSTNYTIRSLQVDGKKRGHPRKELVGTVHVEGDKFDRMGAVCRGCPG